MNIKLMNTIQVLLILGIVVAVIGLYYEVMEAIKPITTKCNVSNECNESIEYELYHLPRK